MATKVDNIESLSPTIKNSKQIEKIDEVESSRDERPVRAVLFLGCPKGRLLSKRPHDKMKPKLTKDCCRQHLREIVDHGGTRHYRKCFVDLFPHQNTPGEWCTARCIEELYCKRYEQVSSVVLVFHDILNDGEDFHPHTPSPATLVYELMHNCPLLEHLQIQGWHTYADTVHYYRNKVVAQELFKLLPRWPPGCDGWHGNGQFGEVPKQASYGRAIELKSLSFLQCCIADKDLEVIPWCFPSLSYLEMYYCGGYSRAVIDQWVSLFYECHDYIERHPRTTLQLYHSHDCDNEVLSNDVPYDLRELDYPIFAHDRSEVSGSHWDINNEGSRCKNAEAYYKSGGLYYDDECQF